MAQCSLSIEAGLLAKHLTRTTPPVPVGIVHLGLGAFFRAHGAIYVQEAMTHSGGEWGILGVSLQSPTARDKLAPQGGTYWAVETGPEGARAQHVQVVQDVLVAPENPQAVLDAMAAENVRIVSLTVTEKGYCHAPSTGRLRFDHPDIVHDLGDKLPRSAPGFLVRALALRRAAGIAPFTVLSCDNLPENGRVLRGLVLELAEAIDPDLAGWIADTVRFPSTMVDRIVPATTDAEISRVARLTGKHDAAPVLHEPFRQWVIEDEFCAGRPDWASVGVQFTKDVHGYEAQKLRILNAGHQVIGNVAEIMGISTVAQAMANPQIKALYRKVQMTEIVPHVVPVPGMTPEQYVDLIAQRFSNPAIHDTIRRVAFDGSSRHPGFVLPSLHDAIAVGAPMEGLALVEAFWARMCAGTREDGSTIAPNDPHWSTLTQIAQHARNRPAVWLEQHQIYGDLSAHDSFRNCFEQSLRLIWAQGSSAALRAYTGV